MSTRSITYTQAIWEAFDICLKRYPSMFIIGEGVPDPKGIFGTTVGLQEKYGSDRVFDMPLSENALTGVCVGAAISGMRPVLTHQRIDFSLLALDQIINSAAKWHYMFNGVQKVPMVVKMTIGMGWGQGPQHSQALQALYTHIPGLKVVMPTTPKDAKGLMIASIEDNNPVMFIEHRWLHNTFGHVPKGYYTMPIGEASIAAKGQHVTIVASSYAVIESLKAAKLLEQLGIRAEVIDLRSVKPIDYALIRTSLRKTKRLIVVDTGNTVNGIAAEIIATIAEDSRVKLSTHPIRIALPDTPAPTSPGLSTYFYPRYSDVAIAAVKATRGDQKKLRELIRIHEAKQQVPHDVPDPDFMGPF